jgi:hypothetical protein
VTVMYGCNFDQFTDRVRTSIILRGSTHSRARLAPSSVVEPFTLTVYLTISVKCRAAIPRYGVRGPVGPTAKVDIELKPRVTGCSIRRRPESEAYRSPLTARLVGPPEIAR